MPDNMRREPTTELHPSYSSEGALPTPWSEGRKLLEEAQMYWLTTVRPDGRPHVTPLMALWINDAIYFTTGPDERKAKNIAQNPQCVMTTGCNTLEGLDVVVEGEAIQVSSETDLQAAADLYQSKYGWHYTVRDGALYHENGKALVFKIAPVTAFGFGKGDTSSQTRWRFQASPIG